ncbi:hypothetical protein HC928_14080 [bacterium]|nr:hypothetical protein [bacterium]
MGKHFVQSLWLHFCGFMITLSQVEAIARMPSVSDLHWGYISMIWIFGILLRLLLAVAAIAFLVQLLKRLKGILKFLVSFVAIADNKPNRKPFFTRNSQHAYSNSKNRRAVTI